VSWIRHRDLHLLTVGRSTYTSDQRFTSIHNPMTEDWTLQVRYPQRRDSGIYECQVGTTPPIGFSMALSVVGERSSPRIRSCRPNGPGGPAVIWPEVRRATFCGRLRATRSLKEEI
ncbi:hypothetical protein BDFB_013947, partial [Asbolus verrucosus]